MPFDENAANLDRLLIVFSRFVGIPAVGREIARLRERSGERVLQESVVGNFVRQSAVDGHRFFEEPPAFVELLVALRDNCKITVRAGQLDLDRSAALGRDWTSCSRTRISSP